MLSMFHGLCLSMLINEECVSAFLISLLMLIFIFMWVCIRICVCLCSYNGHTILRCVVRLTLTQIGHAVNTCATYLWIFQYTYILFPTLVLRK